MGISIGATLAVIGKKLLVMLIGDKKGRKFLGYVIGIAVFICLLPLIMMIGLFGWMSGGDMISIPDMVGEQIQAQYSEQYPEYALAMENIARTFESMGLEDKINLAQTLYISTNLPEKNMNDDFYEEYAKCFIDLSEEETVTEKITEIFGIEFSEKDVEDFDILFKNLK